MGKKTLKPATATQSQFKGFGAFVAGQNFYLMDYVRHGKIQGRSLVFFKARCPCILPCLT